MGLACAALLGGTPLAAQAADTPQCELDRPVRFGGMNWESNLVLVEVERFIMKHGYGCDSEVLPTETLMALAALQRGDLDINSELWLNSTFEPWRKAEASGKVKGIGSLYMGGEGWFIPRYTAERFPELKKAADLPKFKDAFKDPENPGKGRFYGCPAAWNCQVINANLFKGLGLDDSFTLFSPGSSTTQKAALTAAYRRKENVVFYYWFPTSLVGSMDLVQLELPPYDKEKQQCLTDINCPNPQATAYPDNPVFTAVNVEFSEKAPKLIGFLSRIEVPLPVMGETLSYMDENELDAEPTALWFLKSKPDVWTQWLPADVAQRVQAAL
uniref:ABC transporter substrate-binding protein n=1 Tax=Castellaniella defragrans TaxID=75697 RepID=UPI0033401473